MDNDSSNEQRIPLYVKVKEALATAIANQRWRPGEAIPTEPELAETFGTSVGTLRKAVDQLVAEGMLERFQGRGTFIKRARFDSSLFRFFRFQNNAGERRIPESRILHREALPAPSMVATALSCPVGAPTIHLSRLRLIDHIPLLAESIWLPQDKFSYLMDMELGDFPDLLYPFYETECNQVIASAEETLTAENASPEYARLLRLPPATPLIVIERLARSFDGTPLEWRRSRGPADQFRYTVEIR